MLSWGPRRILPYLLKASHSANTTKPVFTLYDALGRPDNLKIGGSFRSRIEGINNQFRPAPVGSDDVLAAFRTNIFAEYDTGHKVKIGAELFDSRGYFQPLNSVTPPQR